MRTAATRLGGIATMAATAAVVAALLPTAAGAADITTLKLDGPAAKALKADGLRFAPLEPATGGHKRVALPVAAALAGTTTTVLRNEGGLVLEAAAGRKLRIGKLILQLGKDPRVTAKLGGAELDLFEVLRGGHREIDPASGGIALDGLRLRLTDAASTAIGERLTPAVDPRAATDWTSRPIGTLSARVAGAVAGGGNGPESVPVASQPSTCPLPSGAGPAAEGLPPMATRPPAAVDVTAASIGWHVRESFIRYIASGEGTIPADGATADAPVLLPGASAALNYDFHFPFAGGWLDSGADPTNPADDRAALDFSGGLRFLYGGHGIDLLTSNPEIELNGAASRAIFAVSEKGGLAQRQVLVNLDLSRAGSISRNGNSYVYDRVPGAIPSGTAASTFAGFYAPGTEFGCFTVSFST